MIFGKQGEKRIMGKENNNKTAPNFKALLPIAIFLILYLGNGIFFEYIAPREGQMGFYVMSVVLAFSISLVAAFFQNKEKPFDDKISICAKGIGDDNIVIMLFIFLMAGAFSGLAGAAGGASSTANLLLNIIPGRFAVPGLFIISCLISMAMGTSVGTISVIAPIACAVAQNGGLKLELCVGVVVGGAMFGDNLSFISDTTIAATKTQGVEMKDKFKTNIRVALPAAVITFIILVVYAVMSKGGTMEKFDFSILQALPYFIVLALSIMGLNVFLVLMVGIVLFIIAGAITGSITYTLALMAMGNGTAGMFGIAFLTAFMDVATANNTVAIVIAAPIAKDISTEYNVEPRKTASLLDTCSCIMQGIIPYGAQLLVASNIAGVTSMSLIPFLIYPFLLIVFVAGSMIREK